MRLTVSPSLGRIPGLDTVSVLAWYSSRFALAPDKEFIRDCLAELKAAYGVRGVSARLGVSGVTVQAWERGRGLGKLPARRLIWLTWAVCLHPECIKTDFDLVTWGRFRHKRG